MLVLSADVQPPVLDRSFWPPLGMQSTASHRTDLNGLKSRPDDVLGPPNTYYRQP